eukprot:UN02559
MPFTGVFADRYDRHKIMIVVSILALLQAVALAICSWLGLLNIALLAVLVFIHSVIIAFMVPAMYGVLPRFVSESALPSAIAVWLFLCSGRHFCRSGICRMDHPQLWRYLGIYCQCAGIRVSDTGFSASTHTNGLSAGHTRIRFSHRPHHRWRGLSGS